MGLLKSLGTILTNSIIRIHLYLFMIHLVFNFPLKNYHANNCNKISFKIKE